VGRLSVYFGFSVFGAVFVKRTFDDLVLIKGNSTKE